MTTRPASHERGAAEGPSSRPHVKRGGVPSIGNALDTVDATTKPNNTQSKMATEAQKGTFAVKVGLAQVRQRLAPFIQARPAG